MPQPLPPKENTLFKSIVRHYETKAYKKGLKAADAVLKKHPDHGETLAMRGLVLNCMDRKTEAYEYVKKGLAKDIRSHVCWHVFGLVYRSDRDYKEAIKCYRNALRIEPESNQILRDLSLLQVQLRDRAGFLETRHNLLKLKPTQRLNWIAIAVANHLLGRHQKALDVLDSYARTLEGSAGEPESAYERSELVLYKLALMRDGGMVEQALSALDSSAAQIVDKIAARETRAELQLALGNYSGAAGEYRRLIAINPEHHGYHVGLQAALLERPLPPPDLARAPGGASPYGAPTTRRPSYGGLSAAERSMLLTAYAELRAAHPRASAPARLPLDIIAVAEGGARFDAAFCAYAIPLLRKGVPSLFADIRPLYADTEKAARIVALIERWAEALAVGGSLEGGGAGGEGGCGAELPTTTMWVHFMLAQSLDMQQRHAEAVVAIDAAIKHTPTLVELYAFKGRVYKHAGDAREAARWVEKARSLDLADRYLNTKATRYLLRADAPEDAAGVIGLFTKDGFEKESNLFEMQCMWYELESGDAFRRLGLRGKALKKLLAVEKHLVDITEDQFDFHTYCLRKMTLSSYVQLLRMEEALYALPQFLRAATSAIELYLELHDARSAGAEGAHDAEDGEAADLDSAERRKAASKARKAAAQAAKKVAEDRERAVAEAKAAAAAASKDKDPAAKKKAKGDTDKKEPDDDPDGARLAATPTPLVEATRLLATLQLHTAGRAETHLLACAVYSRKGRHLLALRALRRALALADASDPRVHAATVKLFAAADAALAAPAPTAAAAAAAAEAIPEAVRAILATQRAALVAVGGRAVSLDAFNADFAERCAARASGVVVAAELGVLLAPAQAARAAAALARCPLGVGACSLADAIRAHKLLASKPFAAAAPTAAAEFARRAASERFGMASYFRDALAAV
jgi:peptide alpha-N-acetyltransferase